MIFSGIVGKGNGIGTAMGFPTVNIPLADASVSGIYAAIVTLDGAAYEAAAYADQKRKLLEAHILDFSGDLYGKIITIELKEKTREDASFPDEDALIRQIIADVAKIRDYFHH